jgi:hypothetical protein
MLSSLLRETYHISILYFDDILALEYNENGEVDSRIEKGVIFCVNNTLG